MHLSLKHKISLQLLHICANIKKLNLNYERKCIDTFLPLKILDRFFFLYMYYYYSPIHWYLLFVFLQVKEVIMPYASPRVVIASSRLQALFEAIPFTDKERYMQKIIIQ